MGQLWQRYLFVRLSKLFLFLLCILFSLYTLVDLSIHGVRFLSRSPTSFFEIALYYMQIFSRHLELFFSLSFLLATLKILLDLNRHRELIALQMAHLSKSKLLTPFFLFAILLSCTCYVNSQWISPSAQDDLNAFRVARSKNGKKEKRENVCNITLDDDTELIYQKFDSQKKELFDIFWVKSADEIWHMKFLKVDTAPVEGRFVDHFARNREGQFEKKESFLVKSFPQLLWNEEIPLHHFIPFEHRPLSLLLRQASFISADRQSILAHLNYKIAMPLLPLLILFAVSPVAMRFTRMLPSLLLIACSLFFYLALMMIMEGMLILGENQVLGASLAIWVPFGSASFIALLSFSHIR